MTVTWEPPHPPVTSNVPVRRNPSNSRLLFWLVVAVTVAAVFWAAVVVMAWTGRLW